MAKAKGKAKVKKKPKSRALVRSKTKVKATAKKAKPKARPKTKVKMSKVTKKKAKGKVKKAAAKASAPKGKKHLYFFGGGKADGKGTMKDLLGGKGAGLAEMTNANIPVPPGFTITTEVCTYFYAHHKKLPPELSLQMTKYMKRIEDIMGGEFGSAENPLLVSVRSGAKFSMPGMMDTILNLGLTSISVQGLAQKTRDRRFAYDCYRRFIQMFGKVVLNINSERFEEAIAHRKAARGVSLDLALDAADMEHLAGEFKTIVRNEAGTEFPENPMKQLRMAIEAVFKSWMNPRAITYRKLNSIPGDLGTAVNVQAMVFGNMGDDSGTGVGFTRDPSTGEKIFYGEYLTNAQGEDVVAGIRTPKPIAELQKDMPDVFTQLKGITSKLEKHYRDVQDFEFTIQDRKLYMLQTRAGKRTGHAAVKIAVDMLKEKLISKKEAVLRVDPGALDQLLHPVFDLKARQNYRVIAKGLNASPGAAAGMVALTADDAVKKAAEGKKVLLIRMETCPDDIHGMSVAQGVLTATGGMTSHAAVVGRQMGKPSVVGCGTLKIDEKNRQVTIGGSTFNEDDYVSIDGATGEVMEGNVPTMPSEVIQVITGLKDEQDSEAYQNFSLLLKWADEFRTLGVRANADIPRDAKLAFDFGAEGIGLCRTEHMFFAEDRLPLMQKMILATTPEARNAALDRLLPMQREDFFKLFDFMKGYPVTIRLLDPPLHEFLPKQEELLVEITRLETRGENGDDLTRKKALLARVQELHEFNPMLGLRGCRLGLTLPEVTKMQVRAIFEAACAVAKRGGKIAPEIMIPLVAHINELKELKIQTIEIAKQVMKENGVKIKYLIGTMIELPRAAITADEIAQEADFFSFGTNDLTQTTYGFSRDDTAKIIQYYQTHNILDTDPFAVLDRTGVGELVKIGVTKGRGVRKNLKVGICGEHGGEPASIEFCHQIGLDYVSCSPYRVPIARLAAAWAALSK